MREIGGVDITTIDQGVSKDEEDRRVVQFKVEKSQSEAGTTALKEEDLWFSKIDDFDIKIYSNFIAFAVQCLMVSSKWESMVELINKFNFVTCNFFASYLLPFVIYAQQTLYDVAAKNTHVKRHELNMRTQMYENWKATSAKTSKKSRQALMTGELPVEEVEFMKEKIILENEIFKLEVIENVLKHDLMSSEHLMEIIK